MREILEENSKYIIRDGSLYECVSERNCLQNNFDGIFFSCDLQIMPIKVVFKYKTDLSTVVCTTYCQGSHTLDEKRLE